ncbi:MAG: AAA family ATPase [Firmicutes bacterium]|nr:AAA family ATPase [Bacillota bacterium]
MGAVLMVQGTAAGAGTSIICAALCRRFLQAGYSVAPFGAQMLGKNIMAQESGLISREQFLQAEAAGIKPDSNLQPVFLLKNHNEYDLYIHGEKIDTLTRQELQKKYRQKILTVAREALEALCSTYDLVVVDGGGNPGENNFLQQEIITLDIKEKYKAPLLVVADIEWGGMFASVAGTFALLSAAEKAQVVGIIVNRFRGLRESLQPGLVMLEDLVQKPVLGVLGYYPQLPVVTAPDFADGKEREVFYLLLSSALQEDVDLSFTRHLLA